MKIVFLGYGEYGAAALSGLLQDKDISVDLIVTHPPKKGDVFANAVAELAALNDIALLKSKTLSENSIKEAIRCCEPDVIVSTNWRFKIPSRVFSMGRIGTLNIHDALLPKYGGLSAEQWVILNGEKETGVTVHFVTDMMDAGPIVYQIPFLIDPTDTAENVASKQLEIYPIIIQRAIWALTKPGFEPTYIDLSQYCRFHALGETDAKLNFSLTPDQMGRHVRAWSGKFGGCWIEIENERFRVGEVALPEMALAGVPGRVIAHGGDGAWIVTGSCSQTGCSGIIFKTLLAEDSSVLEAQQVLRSGMQLR